MSEERGLIVYKPPRKNPWQNQYLFLFLTIAYAAILVWAGLSPMVTVPMGAWVLLFVMIAIEVICRFQE